MMDDLNRIARLLPMLRLVTIRQVLESGDTVIDAAGLNPWCVKEGLATGNEPAIAPWLLEGFAQELEQATTLEAQLTEAREELARRDAEIVAWLRTEAETIAGNITKAAYKRAATAIEAQAYREKPQ